MYHDQETVYCRGLVRPLLPLHCLTALLLHCAVNIYSSTECLVLSKHDPMIMGIVTTINTTKLHRLLLLLQKATEYLLLRLAFSDTQQLFPMILMS